MSEEEVYEESLINNENNREVESNEMSMDTNSNVIPIQKSEEEIAELKERVLILKTEANKDFNNMDYLTALNKYTTIITIAEEIDFKEQLVILYSNKGLCFMKNNEDKKAIEFFSKALEIDNKYTKAIVNRMLINYKLEEYIEALDDFNKIKELDYSVYTKYRNMEKELNYKAEIKKKQMTEEVMGKLKEVGNSFLGLFGLSTNNFQLQQNGGGGYSVNFQK